MAIHGLVPGRIHYLIDKITTLSVLFQAAPTAQIKGANSVMNTMKSSYNAMKLHNVLKIEDFQLTLF